MSQFEFENEMKNAIRMDAPLTRGPQMKWQWKSTSDAGNLSASLNSSAANGSLLSSNKTPMKTANAAPPQISSKTPSSLDLERKTPKSAGEYRSGHFRIIWVCQTVGGPQHNGSYLYY